MKMHADSPSALNTVTAYGNDWIEINRRRYRGALLIMPEGEIHAWQVERFETLAAGDFEALLARSPELVLLGTGSRQRFPHPRLTAALAQAGVGIDVMNTHAACRTYNILMAEGRKVLAALLPD